MQALQAAFQRGQQQQRCLQIPPSAVLWRRGSKGVSPTAAAQMDSNSGCALGLSCRLICKAAASIAAA
jgi:hypothetical protein